MKLTNIVKDKNSKVFLFISGEKSKLDGALSLYNEFYIGLLSYKLSITDMTAMKIVQAIISTLKDKFELEEGFENELESYVMDKYGESDLKSQAFIDLVTQTIIFNHFNHQINIEGKLLIKDIPATTNRRSREDIWKELNGLAGLENGKGEIRNIEQLLSFRKKTADLGLKAMQKPNMHMVFAGNPGTGKTTVARLVAEMLYNIGYIKQNKLIEVSPKDLIGQYIGQTAPKTAAVCESAYDGVLFVDEAYELTVTDGNSGGNQFRSECVTELIKQMEDNRDRLIVIFAGYTNEMCRFLESNAGFASRVGKFIEFEDYTTEQLTAMFIRQAYNNGMRVSDKALERVSEKIEQARKLPHFGNGRYARNLFEKVLLEHAKNTFETEDTEKLTVITEEDIPLVI
jgi:AAA+ superfamily predicted ATPase